MEVCGAKEWFGEQRRQISWSVSMNGENLKEVECFRYLREDMVWELK